MGATAKSLKEAQYYFNFFLSSHYGFISSSPVLSIVVEDGRFGSTSEGQDQV